MRHSVHIVNAREIRILQYCFQSHRCEKIRDPSEALEHVALVTTIIRPLPLNARRRYGGADGLRDAGVRRVLVVRVPNYQFFYGDLVQLTEMGFQIKIPQVSKGPNLSVWNLFVFLEVILIIASVHSKWVQTLSK